MSWQPLDVIREPWGRIQVVVGGEDVTTFRGVPTVVRSWSSAEPFDDSSAVLVFHQITPFEEFGTGELSWLDDWNNVKINAIPHDYDPSKEPGDEGYEDMPKPYALWEGMIASFEDQQTEEGYHVEATCMGALHQVDLYVRAPLLLHEPADVVDVFALQFSLNSRSHLRTQQMVIEEDSSDDIYEYTTKRTGSWNKSLTGYIQEELAVLVTQEDMPRQWTVMKKENRIPVLRMKDYENIHYVATAGTPGITHSLSRDQTQSANIIYGEGTNQAGTRWRNSRRGDRNYNYYEPLYWDDEVHTEQNYKGEPINSRREIISEEKEEELFDSGSVRREIHYSYGAGVDLDKAMKSAKAHGRRDRDPGWVGDITMRSDPEHGSRFDMKAGKNILYKHFRPRQWNEDLMYRTMTDPDGNSLKVNFDGAAFNGENEYVGRVLHLAAVEVNADDLTVQLTVDTKYRDLLSLAEIIERSHDGHLDPTRRLRLGQSDIPQDEKYPWDYNAGSGFIPLESVLGNELVDGSPSPEEEPDQYLHVPAGQWVTDEIRGAEKASIMRTEIRAFNENGSRKRVPFHVSFYGHSKVPSDFPQDPFAEGAWEASLDDVFAGLPSGFIVGWGQFGQRSGYWPGLESEGQSPTGVMIDEGTWQFELDETLIEPGLWVAIYCPEEAWFQGRLRQGVD